MSILTRQLMQPEPLTIAAETPLLEIVHVFVVAQIRSAPVVDRDGAVLGIVSASDLLCAIDQAFDEDVDPGEEDEGGAAPLARLTARDVATPTAHWIAPDAPAARAAHVMRSEGVPVLLVGSDGRLEGILTSFDLLAALEA